VSATEALPGIWGAIQGREAQDGGPEIWPVLAARVDPGEYRPKLADDIEIKEFTLRWGNDYAMIANPREMMHFELKPGEVQLLRLMDGTRTIKEIVLERFQDSGDLELSGVTELVQGLYVGNFLAESYLDTDKALKKALHPLTRRQEAARTFVKEFRVDWRGADRFVRWLHDHGLRRLLNMPALLVSLPIVLGGFAAFIAVVRTRHYTLSGSSLALGFLLLLFLNYFIVCVHEMGHALMLVHYGRRVKSAGFMLYFGSPAFFIESADGLMMDRQQRIVQSFAGAYGEMVVAGAVAIILWAFPTNGIAAILYRFSVVNYLVIWLNLIPLLELDGYWILSDVIQVPDLRPRSLAFVRHDLWHKLRHRQGFSKQEIGLGLYGILGVVFTVLAVLVGLITWRQVFGALLLRLWNGGTATRVLLAVLVIVIIGPVVRGAINLTRVIARRVRGVVRSIHFRLQTRWRVEAAELIDALPLFDDVPEEVLSDLAGRVRLRQIAAGQTVVRQGERAEAFYVVRAGTLQVIEEDAEHGNERPIRLLGRGEAFGELALAQSAPRSATVRALEDSEVFEIGKSAFDQLLADMVHVPEFAPSLQAAAELKGLPCFAHLEPDELGELLREGEWVTYEPGEVIVEQGDVGDAFYALGSGRVDVLEDEQLVRTMGPGTSFGEIALLLDVPRTATVQARTAVRAYRLTRAGFDALIADAFRKGTLNPVIAPDRVWQH
jgi:CRP-like cAMP-binding protein/Zn-dependent protease